MIIAIRGTLDFCVTIKQIMIFFSKIEFGNVNRYISRIVLIEIRLQTISENSIRTFHLLLWIFLLETVNRSKRRSFLLLG